MAISDHEEMRHIRRPRRAVGDKLKRWSDGQKIEAVQSYLLLGNLTLVASVLKIPRDTLKIWKTTEWWKNMVEELRVQDDLQLSTRLQKIISKSFDAVEDRLDHGDFVYDQKTGEMRRKPVSMKDAHKVAVDLTDKREHLIQRHLEEKTISVDKVEKRLAELAASFEEMVNQVKKPTSAPIEVTDVIFGDEELNATKEP